MIEPNDLVSGGRGEAFWLAVREHYDELSPSEHELAVEAARLLDLIEELRLVVAEEGAILGTRSHPALVELRHAREQVRKTLATINMPGEDGDTFSTRRSRRAAQARYS